MAFKNFNQVLLNSFSRYAENPALMFKSGGSYRTMSYSKVKDICFRVASSLIKRGIEPGDRIAIFSQNRPEWAEADTGALLAGAVSSAIYASSLPEEADFIIQNLEATFLFVEDNFQLEKILAIREKSPASKASSFSPNPFPGAIPPGFSPFQSFCRKNQRLRRLRKFMNLPNISKAKTPCALSTPAGLRETPKALSSRTITISEQSKCSSSM